MEKLVFWRRNPKIRAAILLSGGFTPRQPQRPLASVDCTNARFRNAVLFEALRKVAEQRRVRAAGTDLGQVLADLAAVDGGGAEVALDGGGQDAREADRGVLNREGLEQDEGGGLGGGVERARRGRDDGGDGGDEEDRGAAG